MTDGSGSQQPDPPDQRQPGEPNQPGGPGMKMSRNLVSWLVLLGLAILLIALLQGTLTAADKMTITEFQALVKSKQINKLVIKEDGTMRRSSAHP